MVRAVGSNPWDLVHMLNTVSSFGALNPTTNGHCRPQKKRFGSARELDNQVPADRCPPRTESARLPAPISDERTAAAEEGLERSHPSTNFRRTAAWPGSPLICERVLADQVGAIEALQDGFALLRRGGGSTAVPRFTTT